MASIAKAYVTISPQYDKGFGKDLTSRVKGDTSRAGEESGSSFMGKFKGGLLKAAGVVGLFAIGTKIAGSIMGGLNDGIARFDTMNAFPKQMANLGISADESEAAINKLSDRLKGLPTSLDAGAMGITRFVSKNGDIDKSTDMFLALNNAVIAGAAPLEIQNSAMEQLTQAYSKGKMDAMEWRTLQMAMPGQLNQVASAMGMTSDALGEGLRNGSISMDDFMDKIMELNETGTGEFASFEEQARNSSGGIRTMMANVGNAISRGWTKVLDAFGSERLESIMQWITDVIDGGFSGVVPIVEKLGNVFDSVISTVGSLGAKFDELGLVEKLMPAFETIAELAGDFARNIIGSIEEIAPKIAEFIDGFAAAGEQLEPFFQQMAEFLAPVLETVADLIGYAASALADLLAPALETAMEIITNVVIPIIEEVMAFIQERMPVIVDTITSAIDLVKLVVLTVLDTIRTQWETVWDQISVFVIPIWEAIKSVVDGALQVIQGLITTVTGIIEGDWDKVWNGIQQIFSGVWEAIKGVVTSALDIIKSVLTAAWDFISGVTSSVWESIKSSISGALSSAWSTVTNLASSIKSSITGAWDTAKSKTSDAFSSIVTTVSNKISEVIGYVSGLPGRIRSSLGDLSNLLKDAGKQIIDGFLKGLKQKYEDVKKFVGGIGTWIANNKGPKEYDLKLLRPAGRWIMSGLDSSLAENFQGVLNTVGSFAPAIEGAFGDPSLDASSSYSATGAALNGGTTYNYYIDGVQISVGTPEEEAAFETLFGRKLNTARMGMGGAY